MQGASTSFSGIQKGDRPIGRAPAVPQRAGAPEDSPEAWDLMLGTFDDPTLEQSAFYSAGRWSGREEAGVVVREGERVLAMARVVTARLPAVGGGLAYVKFGPVWRSRGRALNPEFYARAVQGLLDEYCLRRRMLLTISPRPHPVYQEVESAILAEHGFVRRRSTADRGRYLVDLGVQEDTRRAGLGQSWRRNLAKAEKAELRIGQETSPEGIAAFGELHSQMVARKNAAKGDPVELLPDLCTRLPTALRPCVFLARHQGVPVAGAVVAVHGDMAYYLIGASSARGLELRAGYALHWWILRALRGTSATHYDLGGSSGEPGLAQFKSGLVGKHGTLLSMAGELDRWAAPAGRLSGDIVNLARRLRPWLRLATRSA